MVPWLKNGLKMALIGVGIGATALFVGCHHRGCGKGFCSNKNDWENKSQWVSKIAVKKLDLDAVQKSSLEELLKTVVDTHKRHSGEGDSLRSRLASALLASTLDPNVIAGMMDDKMNEIKTEREPILKALANFHATLRPEQREKLAGYIKKGHHRSCCP